MENVKRINQATCKVCGLCAEVCPMKIMKKDDAHKVITFRQDRLSLCMKCGQCMAVCTTRSIMVDGLSYDRDFFELPKPLAADTAFFIMIATRRAIRNFSEKPVPREMLEKIVQAIALAPPGFTPIKTEIVVVQDPQIVRAALPHMIKVYDDLVTAMRNPLARFFIERQEGHERFRTIQNHVVPLMQSRLPELKAGTEDTITRYAPAMIIFHANKNAENYEADLYIALTYAFLAAHALGLGGSAMDLIPPAIQHSQELRKLLAIPEDNRVVASMILGYPKYKYQRAIKRELKSVAWI